MSQIIETSFFHTSELPRAKKYEAFRESISVVFEVNQPNRGPDHFDAFIKSNLIGELMLVECQTIGQKFARTNSMIARDGVDHFLVQIFYEGFTVNAKSADQRICGPESILILDMTRSWEALNCDFRNLTLVMPRRLLAPLLIDIDSHHGRMIDSRSNPFAGILIKYLISLDEMTEQTLVEDASMLVRPSLDLVAATLNYQDNIGGESFLMPKSPYRLGMRFRIKEYLDRNLGNPDLTINQVLHQFDLTRDQLERLFPEMMTYLKKRRLELAYNRLVLHKSHRESVEEIAYSLGHKDVLEFRRGFKEQYSISPDDLKISSQQNQRDQREKIYGRLWEEWFRTL